VFVTFAQLHIEGERSATAQRLENVRYVRDRSSKMFQERQFEDLDLRNMNLSGLHLTGADFTGVDLRGAKMNFVDLGVVTRGQLPPEPDKVASDQKQTNNEDFPPEITGVSPNGYDLTSPHITSLIGAKLCGAKLGGSDLRSANLAFANLSDVDLSTTAMTGVILVHADLRSAKLDRGLIKGAIFDDTTQWPKDFIHDDSAPLSSDLLNAFTNAASLVGIRDTVSCD
jgi:uncharacterized protein YjbI with pentapeptide repeats